MLNFKLNKLDVKIRPHYLLIACIFFSLIFTSVVFQKLSEFDENLKNVEVNKLKLDFNQVILKYVHPLQGLASAIHLSKLEFTRENFRRSAESRDFFSNFEGSLGVGFIRRVKAANIDNYINQQKKSFADFNLKRILGTQIEEFLYVIETIEPIENNKQAVGLVISDEKNRFEAAEEAMRLGIPSVTLPIQLVQSKMKEPGLLLMLPVYREPQIPVNEFSRVDKLIGWAYSPLLINPLKALIEKQNPNFKIGNISIIDKDNKTYQIKNLKIENGFNSNEEVIIDSFLNKRWKMQIQYNNPTSISAFKKSIILFALMFFVSIILYMYFKYIESKQIYSEKLLIETKKKVDETTELLSRQKDFLQKTIDTIPAQVGYWDNSSHNVLANKQYHKEYERKADTIKGVHLKDLLGDLYIQSYTRIDSVLKGNAEIFERVLNKNNEKVTYQVYYIPDKENDEVKGFFSIIFDISELKSLQEKEKQQQALLFSKAKVTLLGEMASGIAHEINNPLAIIKAYSNKATKILTQLNMQDEQELKTSLDNSIKTIDKTVDRISAIIKGMRSISRDSTNDPMSEASILEITNNVINLNQEKLKIKSIEFEVINNSKHQNLVCNKVQIEQVMLNLISNAIYEVEKIQNKWIKLIISDKDDFLVFRIVDSGSGIPQEIVDKIMMPFFTTKPTGSGTGIGLSICKSILENHNGKFYYELFHKNTSFVFEVPLTAYKKNVA